MAELNPNFSPKILKPGYLFPTITKEVNAFLAEQKEKGINVDIIRAGIGDTKYISKTCVEIGAELLAREGDSDFYKGYPSEQGELSLRNAISEIHYAGKVSADEIFIGCGAKEDSANFPSILANDSIMAMQNPVYPVYNDSNIIAGHKIITLTCVPENNFLPELPNEKIDVLYLCYPNNPTGVAPMKEQLQKYVDWANGNNVLIIFDAAYESFIKTPGVPHSIYEVPGARNCAVEINSFSKSAGFTDKRCSWTVVPKDIKVVGALDGQTLHGAWGRRQSTMFNGVSYHTQIMAESCLTNEAVKKENAAIHAIYDNNVKIIQNTFKEIGWETFGGNDSPYVWARKGPGRDSWNDFRTILHRAHVVTTPGEGFGKAGEGFIRVSAFQLKGVMEVAMERIREIPTW